MMEHAVPDAGVDHIGLMCPNCKPILTFNPDHRQHIVEHIGAHILHDPSVRRLSEPCGLCLRPAPLCKIVFKKAKGQVGHVTIDMKKSSCPNLVKFSLAAAAQCSNSSPCTNHPTVCSYCDASESSPVIWSYNFRSHMLGKHPSISLERHSDMLVMTKLKKDGMKRAWKHCFKQRQVRRKTQRAPLVISEAHRSRLVLMYVFLLYSVLILSLTQLMHKFRCSEVVPESDASSEDSSSESCSSHKEDVAGSDGEEDVLLVETYIDNNEEAQDLEYGGEWYF